MATICRPFQEVFDLLATDLFPNLRNLVSFNILCFSHDPYYDVEMLDLTNFC